MQQVDKALIEEIVKRVLAEKDKSINNKVKQVDSSGVTVVKAKQVTPLPFDTGNPDDKVWLKDMFSLKESPRLGAGIMEMDSCSFDWTLNYDEIDYIIDGTLEIIVDGRASVGHAGDVILIPKGTKIQFSAPEKCRFMYVVYPADWEAQKN